MIVGWQTIETAPKDGQPLDLLAKTYDGETNRMVHKRFVDQAWKGGAWVSKGSGLVPLPKKWSPTHWMRVEIPHPVKVAAG